MCSRSSRRSPPLQIAATADAQERGIRRAQSRDRAHGKGNLIFGRPGTRIDGGLRQGARHRRAGAEGTAPPPRRRSTRKPIWKSLNRRRFLRPETSGAREKQAASEASVEADVPRALPPDFEEQEGRRHRADQRRRLRRLPHEADVTDCPQRQGRREPDRL